MINIDSVYRKVQDLANKDQRSSIKPSLFNNFAALALHGIIEESRKVINDSKIKIITGIDELKRIDYARDVIDYFYAPPLSLAKAGEYYPRPTDIDTLDDLYYNDLRIEKADSFKHVNLLQRMGRHMNPDDQYGGQNSMVYVEHTEGYSVFPSELTENIKAYYWRKPKEPKWTYMVVNNTPLYDVSKNDLQHIELPDRFIDEITYRIALLAGVNIRDKALMEPLIYFDKKETEENK